MNKLFFIILLLLISQSLYSQHLNRDSLISLQQTKNQQKAYNETPFEKSIHIDRDENFSKLSPVQLLEDVFVKSGACASIENISYKGAGWNGIEWDSNDIKTIGYFNRASSDFPLEDGLIMSTTNVRELEGPNLAGSYTTPSQNPVLGDDDLASLIPGYNVTDVVILEFDFSPMTEVIEFRYIFASEEYPLYVNSQYNDVFGFFINEIGSNVKTNIARLPTTHTNTDIVSINNVNHGRKNDNIYSSYGENPSNPDYFITNIDDSPTTEFNGYTVVLTARYNVSPWKKYHLKLALGNVQDNAFPSGVFLEAQSFSLGAKVEHYGNNIKNFNNVFVGCSPNIIRVLRSEDINLPEKIEISYSGTAVNGVDYISNGMPLPTEVTIPIGETYVDIEYEAINADKYFELMTNYPCKEINDLTVFFYEPAVIASITNTCTRINATASGGAGDYEFSIDKGATWQNTGVFANLALGNYSLWLRDYGGCFVEKQDVKLDKRDITAGNEQVHCDNSTFIMEATPPIGNETGIWKIIVGDADIIIQNPDLYNTQVTVPLGKTATLQWSLKEEDCYSTAEVKLTNEKINYTVQKYDNTCKATLTIQDTKGGTGVYEYSIDEGVTWQNNGFFGNLDGSQYLLKVRDSKGCETSENISLNMDYLNIQPEALPVYQIFRAYNAKIETTALSPVFTTEDILPEGLYLTSSGEISGIPQKQDKGSYDITINVTDINWCTIQKQYRLDVELIIPQILTPNGDGKNDYFMEGFRVLIFDRFGVLIFQGDNGWDGTYKGRVVAPDTYFYTLFDGDKKRTGHITILE